MKAQRVYIDTSVLGGCFDPEFARWSNALIEDFRVGRLKPVISEIITAEVSDAPAEIRELLVDLLALNPESIDITPEVLALADAYQQHGILTPKFYADGMTAPWPRSPKWISWSIGTSGTSSGMTRSVFSQPSTWNGATSRWRSTHRGRWQAMKKTPINAVELVRRIRDAHYEQLRGKSPEERIAFYRAKAHLLQAQVETQRQQQPVNESQPT